MIELAVDRERFPAWYRVIVPRYAGAPRSGQGAARQGGRFNRPGQEALYLSLDKATALTEYQQDTRVRHFRAQVIDLIGCHV